MAAKNWQDCSCSLGRQTGTLCRRHGSSKKARSSLHCAALCPTAFTPGLSLSAAADAALASLGGVESMLKQGDFDGVRHTAHGQGPSCLSSFQVLLARRNLLVSPSAPRRMLSCFDDPGGCTVVSSGQGRFHRDRCSAVKICGAAVVLAARERGAFSIESGRPAFWCMG